ncbi:hypothetical protein FB451DRAFT_1180701 [Mycena latifolia]|nr:hypothetical protein FB451DRAFT_1180701 [Mycena latifolia]
MTAFTNRPDPMFKPRPPTHSMSVLQINCLIMLGSAVRPRTRVKRESSFDIVQVRVNKRRMMTLCYEVKFDPIFRRWSWLPASEYQLTTKVPNWECESKRSWGVKLGLLVAKEPTGDVSEWKGREITEISLAAWPALVTEEVVERRVSIDDNLHLIDPAARAILESSLTPNDNDLFLSNLVDSLLEVPTLRNGPSSERHLPVPITDENDDQRRKFRIQLPPRSLPDNFVRSRRARGDYPSSSHRTNAAELGVDQRNRTPTYSQINANFAAGGIDRNIMCAWE